MKDYRILLLPLLVLVLVSEALANTLPIPGPRGGTATLGVIPQPPSDITARSYILLDFDSNLVVAAQDADMEREPASLAKLMTAYVVFAEIAAGKLALDEKITISERAWRTGMQGGSRMFIEVGNEVRVDDLLRGMIIQSGNDASTALAERIAGSEGAFVDLMNAQARALGMMRSYFANPHGLPSSEPQYTTAMDMATLARALIGDFPELYKMYSERSFRFNNISQSNRNLLLWRDDSFDGLKTGWTSAAGYNLVASAKRNDRRLISVVMGIDAPNHERGGVLRANESQSLINWGMRFFESRLLYAAGEELAVSRVYRGDRKELRVGVAEPLWVVFPQGQADRVRLTLELFEPFEAPLAAGARVGEISASLGDRRLASQPLVVLEAVESGGVLRWVWDGVLLAARSVWPF